MKIKTILRILFLVPLISFLSYSAFFFITNPLRPEYTDCGVIVSKSTDETVIKYGTKTELYLNVQFEKSGFKAKECEPTTYFKHKKGDRVCFDLPLQTTVMYDILMTTGFITSFFIGAALLVSFLWYLFAESDDK